MKTPPYVAVFPGQRTIVLLPFSEVCMHLGVAGKRCEIELLPGGTVQLYQAGAPLSFPILADEAGVHRSADGRGWYGRIAFGHE